MILYHGSQELIEQPVFGKGRDENDYGKGFYCTESIELAKEWACPILNDGYVNQYELDINGLSVLNLNNGKYNILNWLALLLKNRKFDLSRNKTLGLQGKEYIIQNFLPDTQEYDVIVGYRADDRYFSFARDFIQGGISVRQLSSAMKLGELGEQVVLMSQKAFNQIQFVRYEISDKSIYYYQRIEREKLAAETFTKMHEEQQVDSNDIFILDILRGEVKSDDPRLQ